MKNMLGNKRMSLIVVSALSVFAWSVIASDTLAQEQGAPEKNIPVNDLYFEGQSDQVAGAVLPASTHNFVECEDMPGEVPLTLDEVLDETVRFYGYEFTGEEPPSNGLFFFTSAELEANPHYRPFNKLTHFVQGKRYYFMSERDLYFSCEDGLRSPQVAMIRQEELPADSQGYVRISEQGQPLVRFKVKTDRLLELEGMLFEQGIIDLDDNNSAQGVTIAHDLSLWVDSTGDGEVDRKIGGARGSAQSNGEIELQFDGNQSAYTFPANESVVIEIHGEDFAELDPSEEPVPFFFGLRSMRQTREPVIGLETTDGFKAIRGWQVNSICFTLEGEPPNPTADDRRFCEAALDTTSQVFMLDIYPESSCGNGRVEGNEQCDSVRGCTAQCTARTGFACNPGSNSCTVLVPTLPDGQGGSTGDSGSGDPEPGQPGITCFPCEDMCVAVPNGVPPPACALLENQEVQCQLDQSTGQCNVVGGGTTGGGDDHTECRNNQCIVVSGPGSDECNSDSECVDSPTQEAQQPVNDAVAFFCTNDDGFNPTVAAPLLTNAGQWDDRTEESCQFKQGPNTFINAPFCEGADCYVNEYSCDGVTPVRHPPIQCASCSDGACAVTVGGTTDEATLFAANANPDDDGKEIPTGQYPIGLFSFNVNQHSSAADGSVLMDSITFEVNASNSAMDPSAFRVLSGANKSVGADCTTLYSSGQPFSGTAISGEYLVRCSGLATSRIKDHIAAQIGQPLTIILEGSVILPKVNPQNESSLQVQLTNIDSNAPGNDGSNIRWQNSDGKAVDIDWIGSPVTKVLSTRYVRP